MSRYVVDQLRAQLLLSRSVASALLANGVVTWLAVVAIPGSASSESGLARAVAVVVVGSGVIVLVGILDALLHRRVALLVACTTTTALAVGLEVSGLYLVLSESA